MMTVRRSILRIALIAVVLGGLSVTLAAMPVKRPAAGAFEWVQSLGQAERSSYLQDSVLRSLPSEYRQALLASIPRGQARATFWMAAFGAYRDSHKLSPKQVAALNQAIQEVGEIVPGLDGLRSTDAFQGLVANLRNAFGPADVNELMYKTNASATGTVQLPILERLRYGWRGLRVSIGTGTGTIALAKPDCNCNISSDCGTEEGWNCDDQVACNPTEPPGACGPIGCSDYCVFIAIGQPKN